MHGRRHAENNPEGSRAYTSISFRAWTNVPPPSGGYEGLNTTEAITPRAFLGQKPGASNSIYDLSRAELQDMCLGHLRGRHIKTELSSWASSLQTTFRFVPPDRRHEYYISVIDTNDLANPIYHVPALVEILGRSQWAHEYLAHGIISGKAHKAVSLRAMIKIGYPDHHDWERPMLLQSAEEWAENGLDLTATDYEKARRVAVQYDVKFGAAVMIATLCPKQRDQCLWRNGTNGVELELDKYIKDANFEVPNDFCGDRSIMTDVVYTKGYGSVEQMIRMMRAITNLRHGRGARIKIPSEKAREKTSYS